MALLGHQLDALSLMKRTASTAAWLCEHHLFQQEEAVFEPTMEEAVKRPASTALHTRASSPALISQQFLLWVNAAARTVFPGERAGTG